jgi:FRG domain.
MSPPNWGIVPAQIHVFVYPTVRVALQALTLATTTIHAQRLQKGTAQLLSEHLLYRGQTEVTQRILPTRLRGAWSAPAPRQRYGVPPAAPGESDPREHFGDWYEEVRPSRSAERSMDGIPDAELRRRDEREQAALVHASDAIEFASFDEFRKRAAVRHYCGVPSPLLDVSTNPEVAAFFATGGGSNHPPAPGSIGMLCGIDLNTFIDLFDVTISSVPEGQKITFFEMREEWGDNKRMFEDHGILPTRMEIVYVQLPFRRPQAQHARFLSLLREDGPVLSTKTEVTWWSVIERRACLCAFIQDGRVYENSAHNITTEALLPSNEPLAAKLCP